MILRVSALRLLRPIQDRRPVVHVGTVSGLLREHPLILHQRVHAPTERAVPQTPGDVRGDAAGWLGLSLRPPRRQGVELLLLLLTADVSRRRTELPIPRVVHARRRLMTIVAGTLVLVARQPPLIEMDPAVVQEVPLDIGARIVNVLGGVRRLRLSDARLLLIVVVLRQLRLRVVQDVLAVLPLRLRG